MRKATFLLALFIMLGSIGGFSAVAEETEAKDITDKCEIKSDGETVAALADNDIYSYRKVSTVNIESEAEIYGIYIKFDKQPEPWNMDIEGIRFDCGKNGYLHEYVEVNGATSITLNFADNTVIADIFVFDKGAVPSWVHRWKTAEKADIMICPTHSDDDQLYFAGLIPWCAANGYTVQIVYFTNHFATHDRPHELLEGLWHNGVQYYPRFSPFPDKYAKGIDHAIETYENSGFSHDDFVEYHVQAIGDYKPYVIAGHDFEGEYGHGVHMMNAATLVEAVELAAEREIWNVPKTYIHLWSENATVFDWDTPMDELGGKTPFSISQESYQFHKSQHEYESLTRWLYGSENKPITKATEIRSYSPAKFGLYRTTVGEDTGKGDLFENIVREYTSGIEYVPCLTKTHLENALLESNALPKALLPLLLSTIETTPEESTEESDYSEEFEETGYNDTSEISETSDESFESTSVAEESIEETSEDGSVSENDTRKSKFRVSKIMALVPFVIVIAAYFIISAIKRD